MISGTVISKIPSHKSVNDGLEERFKEAWSIVFKAAAILKNNFRISEVRVTGSLLERERFREESDIDLVVPEFSMTEMLDSGKYLDAFHPWRIDVVPLRSMPKLKADYFLTRSVPIGSQ